MCVNNATIVPGVGISYQTPRITDKHGDGKVMIWVWFEHLAVTDLQELLFLSIFSIVRCENICPTGEVLLKLGHVPGQ